MVYGFWHSDPDTRSNDLQFIFTPASFKDGQHGVFDSHPGYTVAAWQHRPEGDRRMAVEAIKLARRLMNTNAMPTDGESYPGEDVQSDDEMLDAARRWGNTTYHVMGTCKMGPASDNTAVVDDQLRVHGLEGS